MVASALNIVGQSLADVFLDNISCYVCKTCVVLMDTPNTNITFNNSGSHESRVSERTFEQWTPRLLQNKTQPRLLNVCRKSCRLNAELTAPNVLFRQETKLTCSIIKKPQTDQFHVCSEMNSCYCCVCFCNPSSSSQALQIFAGSVCVLSLHSSLAGFLFHKCCTL